MRHDHEDHGETSVVKGWCIPLNKEAYPRQKREDVVLYLVRVQATAHREIEALESYDLCGQGGLEEIIIDPNGTEVDQFVHDLSDVSEKYARKCILDNVAHGTNGLSPRQISNRRVVHFCEALQLGFIEDTACDGIYCVLCFAEEVPERLWVKCKDRTVRCDERERLLGELVLRDRIDVVQRLHLERPVNRDEGTPTPKEPKSSRDRHRSREDHFFLSSSQPKMLTLL
jgi:hypothetical protein